MMDKKALMENLARESFEKGGLNGAWLYAEKGEIVSKGALGWCDPENTRPLTEDTIFQLASVSKQFTASAVMLIVRQGLLGLDDKLVRYFPELTAYEGVTVRQMLNHTSGIPDYFEDDDWFVDILQKEGRIPGNGEIPRFLCETKLKPSFAPGEKLEYSNTAYDLLALLVERLSGMPYEDFLQKNIFEPAGMTSTRACHIRRDGVPFDNYARATVFENGRFVADVDSEEDGEEVRALDGLNGDDYVYTNLRDMFTWDRVLRAGTVLTPEEQKLMYTPARLNSGEEAVYDEDEGQSYGFGWAVENRENFGLVVSHSGGMPGVATWFERYIDADRVLILLMSRDAEEYRAQVMFWRGMEKLARDQEAEPVRTIEELAVKDPDKSKWESWCGKYEKLCENFPLEEISLRDGELYAHVVWDEDDVLDCRLYPLGENKFGRKGGMVSIEFGDGCLTIDGVTCKKL